jgi:hypothetical protein
MKPNEVQMSEHNVNNVGGASWPIDFIFFPDLIFSLVQEINYASDAFLAWHLSNAFDMKKFKDEFKVGFFVCLFYIFFKSLIFADYQT